MRGVSYSKRKPRTAPQHAAMAAAGEGGQRSSGTDRRPKRSGSRDSPAALRQPCCSWRSARALPPLSARPGAALCPAGAAGQVQLGIGEKLLLKSGQALEWAVPGVGRGSPSPGVLRNRGNVALRDVGGGHGGGWACELILVMFVVFSNVSFYNSSQRKASTCVRTGMR